jgi:hypothetical protein
MDKFWGYRGAGSLHIPTGRPWEPQCAWGCRCSRRKPGREASWVWLLERQWGFPQLLASGSLLRRPSWRRNKCAEPWVGTPSRAGERRGRGTPRWKRYEQRARWSCASSMSRPRIRGWTRKVDGLLCKAEQLFPQSSNRQSTCRLIGRRPLSRKAQSARFPRLATLRKSSFRSHCAPPPQRPPPCQPVGSNTLTPAMRLFSPTPSGRPRDARMD